jgi:osmotically-inducible protein OsmY
MAAGLGSRTVRDPGEQQMTHLSSCVLRAAAIFSVALGAAACASPDRRTDEERVADRAVAQRVHAELAADRYLDADHIEVQANRGVIHLSGLVAADTDQREALRVSAAVPGVHNVVDDLEIYDFGKKR